MEDLALLALAVAKGFFIFALTIFVLSIIMPPPSKDGKPREKGKEKLPSCPPHRWDYDANGQMYCKECPRKPGQ